jgi:Omp85 superfamily domain/WD40-like Beta Propeller Repeat
VHRPSTFLGAVLAAALVFLTAAARAADDPELVWHSIETPHFRITYYSGEAEIAQHVADLVEAIHRRLTPAIGWAPSERTEIALTDITDSANGSATALPYDAIRLYVTAPDDLSPLGDYDDWYQELVTHEYTHILHLDHIHGIPAIINALIGKSLAPNQVQPRWLLEGLAVYEESTRTSGGRLRSSQWNMWMRADILENNVATLDVFSNTPRRWPQGNIWYLYGSFFMQWVAETYGEDGIRRMIDDYGGQPVPYGMNRSIRRATGLTFEEMYPSFIATLKREYGEQAKAIRARGLREGIRLTSGGNTVEHPRFIPKEAWKDHQGQFLYYRDDQHSRTGLYSVPFVYDAKGGILGSREKDRELLIRTAGTSSASFEPDGSVVFNSVDITNNLFNYYDLFELKAGKKSPSGMDDARARLTTGYRAFDPDVSRDGRRVVFTSNHRGTTYLEIADLTPQGIAHTRTLVRGASFDQAFTPRWSPDNRHVAYSSWTKGGYRDIRIVDASDGSFVEVTHDRAIDADPVYSPDGRVLYFSSDRTAVSNVFAYDVEAKTLKQVTNVINGAYQADVSPDGKTLLYVGYTCEGFDVFAMPIDPSRFLDAPPSIEDRPLPPPPPPHHDYPVHAYNPLYTLAPRNFTGSISPGNFGYEADLSISAQDIAGHHSFQLSLAAPFAQSEPQPNFQYTYGGLPVDLNLSVFRVVNPQTSGYQIGAYQPTWIEEEIGIETGISYNLNRAFDSQSFALTYTFGRIAGNLPFPTNGADPYAQPTIPARGLNATLHLGWDYSNAETYHWSVGPERGFSFGVGFDVADAAIGSQFSGYDATADFAAYFPMPWGHHHALGLHASGGVSGGGYLGEQLFYVGGFVDEPVIDTVLHSTTQGGFALRGYPVVAEAGSDYALFNAEYRFPIVNIDRGLSTLPVFVNRVSGALFVDYGSAFNNAYTAEFKTGTGAELWLEVTVGYSLDFLFRAGFARGWASDGLDKLYFVAAYPF